MIAALLSIGGTIALIIFVAVGRKIVGQIYDHFFRSKVDREIEKRSKRD